MAQKKAPPRKRKKPTVKKKSTAKKKRPVKKVKKKVTAKKKTIKKKRKVTKKKVKKTVKKKARKKVTKKLAKKKPLKKKKTKKKPKKALEKSAKKTPKKKPKKRTQKKPSNTGRRKGSKPKTIPAGKVSSSMKELEGKDIIKATMGFEQLIMKISGTNTKAISSSELEKIGFKTFQSIDTDDTATFDDTSDLTKTSRASLLTIAPNFAFTYWEVTPQTIINTARKIGPDAKLILRFYDTTKTTDLAEAPSWDVEIFDRQGNWYLKLESPEQRLYMEIGMKGETGTYARIDTAKAMHMPKDCIGAPGPIRWIESNMTAKKTVIESLADATLTEADKYVEADRGLLKKTLGPYFYDLLIRNKFDSIPNSSVEAIFHNLETLRSFK